MSDALAKLQASASPDDLRPQRTVETCLAQGVVKRVQVLTDELNEIQAVALFAADEDDDTASDQPARKMGQGGADVKRADEIRAELADLQETMRQHTGRITVAKTISDGDWALWRDKHPPREEGRDDKGRPILNAYDVSVAGGFCNATALVARLGDFVTEWNGEPLAEGQWDWLRDNMPMGDQKEAARWVVTFYEVEGAKAAPKSLSDSLTTPARSRSSSSPGPSASPASDSSAGSPASDTSTSTPAGT